MCTAKILCEIFVYISYREKSQFNIKVFTQTYCLASFVDNKLCPMHLKKAY